MNRSSKWVAVRFSLTVLACSLALLGCKSTPKPAPWTVKITKVTPASIEVDLVGISRSEDAYWRNSVKPDDYWKPNSLLRKQVEKRKKGTNFADSSEFILAKDDPIWNTWSGYGTYELLIMANLPGRHDNSPSDPRRVFLPLDKGSWDAKNKTIEVEISDTQVRPLTPQKP
jgi:hypothetical protein